MTDTFLDSIDTDQVDIWKLSAGSSPEEGVIICI